MTDDYGIAAGSSLWLASLPTFEGFPYLITRVVPAMYHCILLPDDLSIESASEITRRQARANRLQTCLAFKRHRALYIASDGTEHWTASVPSGCILLADYLRPCCAFLDTSVFSERRRRLKEFAEQIRPRVGCAFGDLTKGGREPTFEESVLLAGTQPSGVPRGVARCIRCGEWRGRCIDPNPRFEGMVMDVHCWCDNDNRCAACGAPLYERKLNANYYDERDRKIWHVPGFSGLSHRCQQ
jgi:hypothetical protein